jgi:hypothetical protein
MGDKTESEKHPPGSQKHEVTALSPAEESMAEDRLSRKSMRSPIIIKDPNIVDFDGPDDPEDPKNWSNRYKYILVGLLSAMQTMV